MRFDDTSALSLFGKGALSAGWGSTVWIVGTMCIVGKRMFFRKHILYDLD